MSKKKTRKPQQRRRTRHLTSVPEQSPASEGLDGPGPDAPHAQELLGTLRTALRSDHPMDLLGAVSSLLTVTDPRMADPLGRDDGPLTSLEELVESFMGIDFAETTAALTVIRSLVSDELLSARVAKVLKARRQPLPAWLTDLDSVRVTRVVEMVHVLKDGDDYFLEARFPTGEVMTALVYVDHNMGGVVKDAFTIAEPVDAIRGAFAAEIDDPDTTFEDVDAAVARAVIEQAVDLGARTLPQPESESWPGVRPLVEWLVRMLPPGGEVPEHRSWDDEELAALREEFFASSYARGHDSPDGRGLVDDFLWFATGWGSGDPLRWSPVRVEILLADWIPRKIVADVDYLAKAPALLKRFVEYSHGRAGVSRALTDETLEAVGRWEPGYQRLIRSERAQGAEAIAEALTMAGGYDDEDDIGFPEVMLESLDRAVGGRATLMSLDTSPLPDAPFPWTGVPEDIHGRVREVLELCDRCADALFDVEHRTAFRRFLSRAAAADPGIFRRKGAADRAAAAVCWAVAKANGSIGPYGRLESQELTGWFGVKGSVSQRAEVFLRANGVNPHEQIALMDLGTPDLLTSARRAGIVELRDRYLAMEE